MKCCLSIAGSDCSGGAGIQADVKTFSANGTFGMSVITAVVAENTSRVLSIWAMDCKAVEEQLDAVFEDSKIDGVKLGMLPNTAIMQVVIKKLLQYKARKIVTDPVMEAKGGCALMEESALAALKKTVIPASFLLTPNIPEAQAITGMQIQTTQDVCTAAERLYGMGAQNVLVKGGHMQGDATDVLFDGKDMYVFTNKRIDSQNTHGTGCTLSSAITANLAKGLAVKTAVEQAKAYVTQAILHAFPTGKGHGPINHFYEFYKMKGVLK